MQYKRTVDVVGEVTEEGKAKLKEELSEVHSAFRQLINVFRPQVDMEQVGTGEAWLAVQAKDLGLIGGSAPRCCRAPSLRDALTRACLCRPNSHL